jgi:hypothetical protein
MTVLFAGVLTVQPTLGGGELLPKGFESLIQSDSLDGWKGGGTADPRTITPQQQAAWNSEIEAHWRLDGEELVSDGHGPHLATDKLYGDFELWVDWKLSPGGDSGIYLRDLPQVQLWDPGNQEAHQHGSDKGSGGLWNNQKAARFPAEVADKPIGEWNRMFVRVVGDQVTVILNGKTVVDDVSLENYFDRNSPAFPRGSIHLQTHGSETRFRNLFVREIPAEEANQFLAEREKDGFNPIFNGKDFAGWIGGSADYDIIDGVLQGKPGRASNLLTEKTYDDFAARFEFKLPPGGNSGLAIRTAGPDVNSTYEAVEIQVLDDDPAYYPDIKDYQMHGSVYGLAPATPGYRRPTGEWNFEEIIVRGNRVIVNLNGFTILNADLAEAAKQPLDGLAHPGATRTNGHFGFCGHADAVSYRNLQIKELTK